MRFRELIEELESLSKNGVYKRVEIEWWLLKHELRYRSLSKDIDNLNKEFPDAYVRNHSMLQNEAKFLDIYEALLEVIECYNNELYYKEEMKLYRAFEEDKTRLNSWFQIHKFDEGKKQSKFKQLFQNTSTLSGYEFIIRYPLSLPVIIKLDESDFQHTVKFLTVLN